MKFEHPKDWTLARFSAFLKESRIPGSNGLTAKKITVRLYGKGVVASDDPRPGSAGTRYYRRRGGQLIYSKLDFLNGAIGIIPPNLDGYESTLDLPSFDIGEGVDPEWLTQYMSRPAFYLRYRGSADGSRVAKRVGVDELLASRITLPSLQEQRAIARVLCTADETIRGMRVLIKELGAAKRSVMGQLLSHGFPSRSFRAKKTRIGFLPPDWEATVLGSVLVSIRGGSSPTCDSRPAGSTEWGVLKLSAVTSGIFRPQENKALPSGLTFDGSLEVKTGDLLLTRSNTPELVGMTCYVEETRPRLLLSDLIWRLEVNEDRVCARFLNQCLKVGRVRKAIEQAATGTSGSMKKLSQSRLREVTIPLPPLDIQREFAKAGEAFDRQIAAERAYLEQLQVTKRGLAQALLSGRVRVPSAAPRGEA